MKKNNNIKVYTSSGVVTTPLGFLKLQETRQELRAGILSWVSNPYFWVFVAPKKFIKSHYWLFEEGRLYDVGKGDFEVTIKDEKDGNVISRTYSGKRGLALLRQLCLPVVENW